MKEGLEKEMWKDDHGSGREKTERMCEWRMRGGRKECGDAGRQEEKKEGGEKRGGERPRWLAQP